MNCYICNYSTLFLYRILNVCIDLKLAYSMESSQNTYEAQARKVHNLANEIATWTTSLENKQEQLIR